MVWGMQTEQDAQRIQSLGAKASNIHLVGNLKADAPAAQTSAVQTSRLKEALGLTSGAPLWIAGSTHPGEEATVLSAYRQVCMDGHRLHLMLAPRHPERVGAVERAIRKVGLVPKRRSAAAIGLWETDEVMILDTIGELAQAYALAEIVFVGGSLIPHGGQNLLEPAQAAKPILAGPHLQNFQSIADLLQKTDGMRVVTDSVTMAAQVRRWLKDTSERESVGRRAQEAMATQAGSTEKAVELLGRVLGTDLAGD